MTAPPANLMGLLEIPDESRQEFAAKDDDTSDDDTVDGEEDFTNATQHKITDNGEDSDGSLLNEVRSFPT